MRAKESNETHKGAMMGSLSTTPVVTKIVVSKSAVTCFLSTTPVATKIEFFFGFFINTRGAPAPLKQDR